MGIERDRANGASGKRCDIDAAKRRSRTENWEIRVNQSKPKLTHVPNVSQTARIMKTVPGGNGADGMERYRRSPKGKRIVDLLDRGWYSRATADGKRPTNLGVVAAKRSDAGRFIAHKERAAIGYILLWLLEFRFRFSS
jgi:hypothetical protein